MSSASISDADYYDNNDEAFNDDHNDAGGKGD